MTGYGLITVRETRVGDVRLLHVLNPFPDCLLMAPEFAEAHQEGEAIQFSFQNGRASYEKTGEDDNGNWQCRLLTSEYEPVQ